MNLAYPLPDFQVDSVKSSLSYAGFLWSTHITSEAFPPLQRGLASLTKYIVMTFKHQMRPNTAMPANAAMPANTAMPMFWTNCETESAHMEIWPESELLGVSGYFT